MNEIRIILVLAAATASSAVHAQTGDQLTEQAAIRAMHEFSACVVEKNRSDVARLFGFPPGSPLAQQRLRDALAPACLARTGIKEKERLNFRSPMMRGMLAEALFEREFGMIAGAPSRSLAAPFRPLDKDKLQALPREGRHAMLMLGVAGCLAHSAGNDVLPLFKTEAGSAEESRAFAVLAAKLPNCTPQGATLSLNKPLFRGYLAEAAYRAAAAAPSAGK